MHIAICRFYLNLVLHNIIVQHTLGFIKTKKEKTFLEWLAFKIKIWNCLPLFIKNKCMKTKVWSQRVKHCPSPKFEIQFVPFCIFELPHAFPRYCMNQDFHFASITHCFAASCWYHCWNFVNMKCSVMLSVLNILWTDLQPTLLSASLSVLHLGRQGL